jgi:hypothetical protein
MNDQRIDSIWPKIAGLRTGWRKNWVPQVGMVGFVVGCLSPNHAAASSESHNILLVKIDDDLCIPISEKGVKEYKMITSPPLPRHGSYVSTNTAAPKNQTVDEQEQDSKEKKDEQVAQFNIEI